MHRDLKALLERAHGETRFVVVVFLDVRGFSAFPWNESSETAEFLKSAYTRILRDYFEDASFFEPTGDGLLLIFHYDRETLEGVVRRAVETSLRLVDEFAGITSADPMVNFPVPHGRPLNLASRLMDVVRPSGVVFDESLGAELVGTDLMARFRFEDVYVKSLAEGEPIGVYCTADRTVVPEANRGPINPDRSVAATRRPGRSGARA